VTLRVFNIDTGSPNDDVLDGTGRDDLIRGGAGSDTVHGDGGDDRLNGGRGVDEMHGGSGNDIYLVDNADDQVVENAGEGTDRVAATISYTLADEVEELALKGNSDIDGTGNGGANRLIGNDGDNTLAGMAGHDFLNGGNGDDVLIGGDGRDIMIGGAGNDRYVFGAVSDSPAGLGRDVIRDFVPGNDIIDISGIDADPATANDQAFTFIGSAAFGRHAGELQARFIGPNTLVAGDVDGDGHADFQVVLGGQATLQASDFML
jgi:Ca2+-binding RTX toxin-like protein